MTDETPPLLDQVKWGYLVPFAYEKYVEYELREGNLFLDLIGRAPVAKLTRRQRVRRAVRTRVRNARERVGFWVAGHECREGWDY